MILLCLSFVYVIFIVIFKDKIYVFNDFLIEYIFKIWFIRELKEDGKFFLLNYLIGYRKIKVIR